jgi:DNA polymerase-3 subunit gamma/tau
MGQALYRKYRSKSLGEIVGQEHITDTLSQALKSGRISHAYLFSGPRGVGKTSIARILAHEINGLPYEDDSAHLDIIEIDAASNRRIDEIRELRDKVYIAPTSGKYKVYIIDEVHMLTREAFNALLKTLEEPPEHAVFILATTEAHKLPETIISRTQHYTFKPVERAKVIAHLKHIAKEEGVKIDDKALALLAEHGEGSFRDSISVLDQARSVGAGSDKPISVDDVRQLLGIAPETAINRLVVALAGAAAPAIIIEQLNQLYGQGLQAASIASQLSARIRNTLADGKPVLPVGLSLRLLRELIEVPASHDPERLLEICLLDLNAPAPVAATPQPAPRPAADTKVKAAAKPAPIPEPSPAPAPADPPKAGPEPEPNPVSQSAAEPEPENIPTPIADPVDLDPSIWPQVLENIKKQYNTIYGVLRMATPVFTAEGIELQFKFAFHQKRLNEVKNKQIIADFVKQLTGSDVNIVCTYVKDAAPGGGEPVQANPAAIENISNIFGGAEVI